LAGIGLARYKHPCAYRKPLIRVLARQSWAQSGRMIGSGNWQSCLREISHDTRGRGGKRRVVARPLMIDVGFLPVPRQEIVEPAHGMALGQALQDIAEVDDALAREMFGQRATRRLATLEGLHRNLLARRRRRRGRRLRCRLGRGGILLQIGKLKLEFAPRIAQSARAAAWRS
jgi:hypothetical protein